MTEKIQIKKNRNKRVTTTDATGGKMYRRDYEQLYSNQLDNIYECINI